jgi:hypothetical protein
MTTISHLQPICCRLYAELGNYTAVAKALSEIYPELPGVNHLRSLVRTEVLGATLDDTPLMPEDAEIVAESVKLAQKLQRYQDVNRIERKTFRAHARAYNAVTDLQQAILEVLRGYGDEITSPGPRTGPYNGDAPVAVLQLSDLHLNELIDLPHNKYDFEVAAKRLQLLASKTKLYAKANNCERIVIVFGGDIINSDRRLDEVLSMATNRARAAVLATHLLRQLILDLRADFFIDTFAITGNEGRAKQELAWGDPAVSDSYDASVYWMLEQLLGSGDIGLRMHPLHGNEVLFQIHNQIFLVIHGHQITASDQRKVQSIIGKHSAVAGQKITHILCGHIHSTMLGDFISRNSSLAGSNAYSDEGLQFASKAAQNLHIVSQNSLEGIKLDLQDTQSVAGYAIIEQLQAHCARSVEKARQTATNKTSIRIVV